jgi:hypothetical protein
MGLELGVGVGHVKSAFHLIANVYEVLELKGEVAALVPAVPGVDQVFAVRLYLPTVEPFVMPTNLFGIKQIP